MITYESAKATVAPLVAPVQDIGFPMAMDTWERGLLVIEQVQRIIDQLQDEPNLIGMTSIPTDNSDESQASPSSPEFIDID